jgi:hypothetical protein
MIELIVNQDNAEIKALLSRIDASKFVPALNAIMAEAGSDITRTHLYGLASKRHRSSQRLNFYARAADSVVTEIDADGALIKIPHTGLALRYFGGRVVPSGRTSLVTGRPIRRLAVPIPGNGAEGKLPAEFPGMFMVRSRKGNALLAGRKPNGMVSVLFMLLPYTDHAPDESVLPTDAQYQDAAVKAVKALVDRKTNER